MAASAKKILKYIGIGCAAVTVPVLCFYVYYNTFSDRLGSRGYDYYAANAIKHAYAAAGLYQTFLLVGSPAQAEDMVLWLGTLNERIERVTKYDYPDSLPEVKKDMHNNLAGIAAVQWMTERKDVSPILPVIETMAKSGILIVNPDENPFPDNRIIDGLSNVEQAEDWLGTRQNDIRMRVLNRLDRVDRAEKAN